MGLFYIYSYGVRNNTSYKHQLMQRCHVSQGGLYLEVAMTVCKVSYEPVDYYAYYCEVNVELPLSACLANAKYTLWNIFLWESFYIGHSYKMCMVYM